MTEHDETTKLLIRARSYIERGWCRDANARDEIGCGVSPTSDRAVAWCMVGALKVAGWNGNLDHPAAQRLFDATNGKWTLFNDWQETVEPVLAASDRAIAAGQKPTR